MFSRALRQIPPPLKIVKHCWLFADTYQMAEGTVLAVRKSLRVLETSPEFAPVAAYIARYGFSQRSREVRSAPDMVGRKVEITVYDLAERDDDEFYPLAAAN